MEGCVPGCLGRVLGRSGHDSPERARGVGIPDRTSGAWGLISVMTVHKLTAGDGYTYLTRQVASMDVRRTPGESLADYYTAHGNPPGVWMGAGAASLGVAGTVVSEAQMRALFGAGAPPGPGAEVGPGGAPRANPPGGPEPRGG